MEAPASLRRKGGIPFTEARVPTGMKVGVGTSPWGCPGSPSRPSALSAADAFQRSATWYLREKHSRIADKITKCETMPRDLRAAQA